MAREEVGLILAAAGRGERFGGEAPKQFLPFRGKSLYRHALSAFRDKVAVALVVVPPAWRERVEAEIGSETDLAVVVVDGGETRQESVLRGLRILEGSIRWVLVHDGARPLVDGALVDRVLEKTVSCGACIPVLPVRDTVKQLAGDGSVLGTLPRERLSLAQTPQGFSVELLTRAFEAAGRERYLGTDESQLVERLGERVHVVEGNPVNLKVTRARDWRLMEALARAEEKDWE